MTISKPTHSNIPPKRESKKESGKDHHQTKSDEWWEEHVGHSSKMKLCDRCEAVYFDGFWHNAPEIAWKLKEERGSSTEHTHCTECNWIVTGVEGVKSGFEGQITLDCLDDPKEKGEILSTVRNFAQRATKRDPQDQIIAIEDRGNRVVITTTENQMAVGIGKAVDKAYKGGSLRIVWSEDDLPARVYWKHK